MLKHTKEESFLFLKSKRSISCCWTKRRNKHTFGRFRAKKLKFGIKNRQETPKSQNFSSILPNLRKFNLKVQRKLTLQSLKEKLHTFPHKPSQFKASFLLPNSISSIKKHLNPQPYLKSTSPATLLRFFSLFIFSVHFGN